MKSPEIDCVGYSIAADWYEGDNDEVLLVLPGYNSSKDKYTDLVGALVEKTGTNVLVIDYTGHGKSPFKIDELRPAQNFLEVITAYDWLKDNHSNLSINVMGTSYGGYLAANLTNYREVNKLVLRVPAIYPPEYFYTKQKYIRDIHYKEYRQTFGSKIQIDEHPVFRAASDFSGKVLVVIHELDEHCPEDSTLAFAKAFDADTQVAKGLKHGMDNYNREQIKQYQQNIAGWLNKQ